MEIHISIKIKENFPNQEEQSLGEKIEDLIQENDVGEVVDSGAGLGVMDIFVEPKDEKSIEKIKKIIDDLGVNDEVTVS